MQYPVLGSKSEKVRATEQDRLLQSTAWTLAKAAAKRDTTAAAAWLGKQELVGYGTLTESDKIELKPMICGPPIRDGD